MFCEKCGQANPDGATFCESCGEEFKQEAVSEANENPANEIAGDILEKAKAFVKKYNKIVLGAGAALVLIILLAIFGVFKSGSLKAVEKLNKAYLKGDGKAVFTLKVDPYTLEKNIDAGVYKSEDGAIEMATDEAEESKDRLDKIYGKGVKVKTEHIKTTKYKKDDVAAINEYLEEMGYDENYISALHLVKVKETWKGKEDINISTPSYVVAKIDGKWYVDVLPNIYGKDSIEEIIKKYK